MARKEKILNLSALWKYCARINRDLEDLKQQISKMQKERELSPEEEFRQKYPDDSINPEFFRLVGVLPPTPIEFDKAEIVDAIKRRVEG